MEDEMKGLYGIFLIGEMNIPHTVGFDNPHIRRNARYMYIILMFCWPCISV